ncbi:hypothetical protein [Agrococcus baldri]|nr:hypothetical protein [Agrococcus baldri]
MTSAAQDFVDLVVRLVAGSSDDDWLVLSITESVVLWPALEPPAGERGR